MGLLLQVRLLTDISEGLRLSTELYAPLNTARKFCKKADRSSAGQYGAKRQKSMQCSTSTNGATLLCCELKVDTTSGKAEDAANLRLQAGLCVWEVLRCSMVCSNCTPPAAPNVCCIKPLHLINAFAKPLLHNGLGLSFAALDPKVMTSAPAHSCHQFPDLGTSLSTWVLWGLRDQEAPSC